MAGRIIFFIGLVTMVSASAINQRAPGTCSPTRTEGFDQPNSLLGGIFPGLFGLVNTGTYGELSYSGASKVNFNDVLLLGTVEPKSKPNAAVIGAFGTATTFLITRLFGTSYTIDTLNPNTEITPVPEKAASFDLKSVYLACGAVNTANGLAGGISGSCAISVTGTDVDGNEKSGEAINFGPGQLYNSTMQLRVFQGWEKMRVVRFQVTDSAVANVATTLFFDDLKYCVRK